MKHYTVTEVFSTVQGEGAQAGTPAVFVRFTGCNAWTGQEHTRERDLARTGARCALWCDTFFATGDRMPLAGVVAAVRAVAEAAPASPRLVVFTGGEPLLQLDTDLCTAVKAAGFRVAVETNGSIAKDVGADWVCVSPKWLDERWVLRGGNELKLVVPAFTVPEVYAAEPHVGGGFTHLFVQPMDDANVTANTASALRMVQEFPAWRLSLQTHKLLGLR